MKGRWLVGPEITYSFHRTASLEPSRVIAVGTRLRGGLQPRGDQPTPTREKGRPFIPEKEGASFARELAQSDTCHVAHARKGLICTGGPGWTARPQNRLPRGKSAAPSAGEAKVDGSLR